MGKTIGVTGGTSLSSVLKSTYEKFLRWVEERVHTFSPSPEEEAFAHERIARVLGNHENWQPAGSGGGGDNLLAPAQQQQLGRGTVVPGILNELLSGAARQGSSGFGGAGSGGFGGASSAWPPLSEPPAYAPPSHSSFGQGMGGGRVAWQGFGQRGPCEAPPAL